MSDEIALFGVGTVGARAARQLLATDDVQLHIHDADRERAGQVARSLGDGAHVAPPGSVPDVELAVLCGPARTHVEVASSLVDRGISVVSISDNLDDTDGLLALDGRARAADAVLLVGCGFSPGFSCLLASHGASRLESVDEIHVAKSGTGGPACARQHHRALGESARDWTDGVWERRSSGSGRELNWFPDPIGAMDCYRAALPEPALLVPAFPDVQRVTARVAANRRNRLTARLPMLRRPHPDGGPGAIRVELRGTRDGATTVDVLGAMDHPAVAGALVAITAARWALSGRCRRVGAGGLAEMVDPLPFLQELARLGVKAATFEGPEAAESTTRSA